MMTGNVGQDIPWRWKRLMRNTRAMGVVLIFMQKNSSRDAFSATFPIAYHAKKSHGNSFGISFEIKTLTDNDGR